MEIEMRGFEELARRLAQAPEEVLRATRNSLNDTARAVQSDFRATLPQKFDVKRRTYIERSIYFGAEDKATKEKLEARLSVRGPGGKPSVLNKFEADRKKLPRGGGRLAIPSHDIRTTGGHIRAGTALKNFLPIATLGGSYTQLKRRKGRLVAGKTLTTHNRLVGQRGSFIVPLKSGYEALARRRRGSKRDIELLYVFQPQVEIPDNLAFLNDARRSAYKWAPVKLNEAVDFALRRAGLK